MFSRFGKAANTLLAVMLLSFVTISVGATVGGAERNMCGWSGIASIWMIVYIMVVQISWIVSLTMSSIHTLDYLVPKLRTEHDMIVDIVDAVVCSSMHAPIIPYVQLFVNIIIASRKAAPFILPHEGRGFQGRGSIKWYNK
jgi:hypothetical protein